jgi:uncharacterized protein (TIGR04255 family)
MPIGQHYPHAPITEALVDLRVNPSDSVSLEKLKLFGKEIKASYPFESTRNVVQAEIKVSGGATTQTTTTGYLFHSGNREQAVQARIDGFTFSRFAPYDTWEQMVSEARRLWSSYYELIKPKSVTRLAVRYVNQINLPLGQGPLAFEEYLKTFPRVGEEAGQDVTQFLLRLVLPQPDLDATLILTEALVPGEPSTRLGVILDIDLFRETVVLPESPEIWTILDTFRARKNVYFEASITDRTRELFR